MDNIKKVMPGAEGEQVNRFRDWVGRHDDGR
jgi:hypothetical protein